MGRREQYKAEKAFRPYDRYAGEDPSEGDETKGIKQVQGPSRDAFRTTVGKNLRTKEAGSAERSDGNFSSPKALK